MSIIIQKYVRKYLTRKIYLQKRQWIILLQTRWRQHNAQVKGKIKKEAILRIQRFYRSTSAKKLRKKMQESLVILQDALRIRLARALVAYLIERNGSGSGLRKKPYGADAGLTNSNMSTNSQLFSLF
jgi:hypothetical protein